MPCAYAPRRVLISDAGRVRWLPTFWHKPDSFLWLACGLLSGEIVAAQHVPPPPLHNAPQGQGAVSLGALDAAVAPQQAPSGSLAAVLSPAKIAALAARLHHPCVLQIRAGAYEGASLFVERRPAKRRALVFFAALLIRLVRLIGRLASVSSLAKRAKP